MTEGIRKGIAFVSGLILFSSGALFAQVSGFVSDPTLKPFPKAVVEFITPDENILTPRRYEVSSAGTFRVDPGSRRLFALRFIAAFCESREIMIYLPKAGPLKLDVRLKPYSWVDDFKDVKVIGDFNGFDEKAGISLHALSDGTYFADVENRTEGKMGYRLTGLVRDSPVSVTGTHSDELTLGADGNYVSRLNVKPGKVRVVFDPGLLPGSFGKAEVIFDHPNSTTAKVASVNDGISKRRTGYVVASQTFVAAGHDFKDFHYDWSGDVSALKKQIAGEKDEAARQALWIALLDLGRFGSPDIDRATARKALKNVPPDFDLWEIGERDLLFETIRLAGGLGAYQDYFEKVITRNPSRIVRACALERAYLVARREKDRAKSERYYRLLTEEYGDLLPGQRVKSMPPEIK